MLEWGENDLVRVGDTTLLTMGVDGEIDGAKILEIAKLRSTSERLVMVKTRRMIEFYAEVLERLEPRRVLELGIFQGGSVALVAEMVAPESLVAIDLEPEPVPALEEWISRRSGSTRIRTYYGVDQADTAALRRIVADDFDGPLDLVIDDGSHLTPESRISFGELFPRLRPGGIYLVEDWAWAHHMDSAFLSDSAPLTLFLFELVIACAHVPGLIERIEVGPDIFTVRRGPAEVPGGVLDLSAHFDERARGLVPDLGL